MKKLKAVLTCLITCVFAGTMFVGCGPKKDDQRPQKESYVDQSYALSSATSEEEEVSVKLTESGKAYLVYEMETYMGTYNVDESDKNKITLSLKDGTETFTVNMTVEEAAVSLKDAEGSDTLIGSENIKLSKKDDSIFANGLYLGLGRYFSGSSMFGVPAGYDTQIEGGAYTYKISDNEIYTCDSAAGANQVSVEVIGNHLVYTVQYDKNGTDVETNLFFIENKGEHDQGFINAFGDVDNTIYFIEAEGGGYSKYYFEKVDETSLSFKVTEDITYETNKLFKVNYAEREYVVTNVNISVKVKTTGDVVYTISGSNAKTINGKWYNISDGVLIVLDEEAVFGKYFAIARTLDEATCIFETESIAYQIGWTEEVQNSIINGNELVDEL